MPPGNPDGECFVWETLADEIISHPFSVVKREIRLSGAGSPALISGVSSSASTATAATHATLPSKTVPYKDETGGRGWHTGFCSSWSEQTVSSINAGGRCRQLAWSRVVGGSR